MSIGRWKNHKETWPKGMRPCTKCEKTLPFSEFHKHKDCLFGINTVCKACRRVLSKSQWRDKPLVKRILHRAKTRATKLGREFSLTEKDICIPDVCPVFGVPFSEKSNSDFIPSIDRLDSNQGYVPGNIVIMTKRANLLKNNGTIEEFEMILNFLKSMRDSIVRRAL